LNFATLEDVLADVEHLLSGHRTVGGWSLGQILYHLATAIRVSSRAHALSEAEPFTPEFRQKFFQERRFPEGIEAPHPRLIPPTDADATTESRSLSKAIARWNSAPGPFAPHPLLGTMSKEEWTQFHCIHCAHHLGFAVRST
jgi:hypothetical protein